jgi:hypothetical protein
VKGYQILQTHSNEIIIRRYIKFDENILACEPNSTLVPSSSCEPYSTFEPYFVPILVSSLDDDSEDENPPLLVHLPPDESVVARTHAQGMSRHVRVSLGKLEQESFQLSPHHPCFYSSRLGSLT